MGKEISEVNNPPSLSAANGHSITPCGSISLDWRWNETGNRLHRGDFYVFPESNHLDVIFGAEYIAAKKLLTIQDRSFSPLTRDRKETHSNFTLSSLSKEPTFSDGLILAQEADNAKAKQQHEKEKAEVEAQRKASRNKKQQQSGQSSQSQGQQQG